MTGPRGELPILPPGTQVVTTVDLRGDAGGVRVPRGALGTILRSPADGTRSYWVRLVDGAAHAFTRAQLATLARFQDHELAPHGGPELFARVILPQATKIAIPNIGSMFIGMVKDTSTFTVIGLLEVVRVTQNLNSTTFQPFVLYTAAAGLYVVAAFGIDLLFRTIEKLLATPPSGRVARAVSRRRRKRLEAVMLRLESASGRT